jgi:hypothetical protein
MITLVRNGKNIANAHGASYLRFIKNICRCESVKHDSKAGRRLTMQLAVS